MRFSTLSASVLALASAFRASAAPIKRTANPQDVLVLKFAHVLEQFETQFYTQALATFQESDFVSAGFVDAQLPIQQFTAIQADETAHTSILASTIIALGDQPITNCQFNFGSALSSVSTMAVVARVVEDLGVAAYLGAAHLISDPVLLTAAGSILTVEARHQTILNILNAGSAIPQAFDIAFSPSEVLAIASIFISGCDVGIPANPTLSLTNTGSVSVGTSLSFASPALNSTLDPSTLSCQMLIGGAPFAIVLPFSQCVVPDGVNGPVALFITSDPQPLNNNIRDQATNSVVAGPTMIFIDTQIEVIAQLARAGSPSVASASSVVTATISPAQASQIAASAISESAPAATATSTSSSSSPSASASPTDNSASPGPNMATGSADSGALNVMGWSPVSPS